MGARVDWIPVRGHWIRAGRRLVVGCGRELVGLLCFWLRAPNQFVVVGLLTSQVVGCML